MRSGRGVSGGVRPELSDAQQVFQGRGVSAGRPIAYRRLAPLALRLVRRFFAGAARRAGLRRATLGARLAIGSLVGSGGALPRIIDKPVDIQVA